MGLNSEHLQMSIDLAKNLLQKELEKISTEIKKLTLSVDPIDVATIYKKCDRSLAEITSRLEQLKTFIKPDPEISN